MRIICMSGYTDDSAVRHGFVDAAVHYLQKPLTPDSLLSKVRAVLDQAGPP
jgi:DNA-binding response OmpR family regulator